MEYLEAMELICYASDEVLKSGRRAQIQKSKMNELATTLLQIHLKLGDAAKTSTVLIVLDDMLKSIKAIQAMNIVAITEEMRKTLEQGVYQLKVEIAKICFEYYSKNEFEDSPEIVTLMREVVRCVIGGEK